MSETHDRQTAPADRFGRALYIASRWLAIFGGLVLCAMALLTSVSVTGRSLTSVSLMFGPIAGDDELIAVGTGVAVFAFLPFCQMTGRNVIVDFFMSGAPNRLKLWLDALGCLIYGAIMALFTWRTIVGGIGLHEVGESTYILAIPRWWTFPLAIVCLIVLVLVCFYTLGRAVDDFRRNRPVR
jgi:TRAP-type C4-dicarboxylate transport system permease small subunit